MTPEQRKVYEQRAKASRVLERDAKYTSQGVNIAEIEQQENESKTREQNMKHTIQTTIDKLAATESITSK